VRGLLFALVGIAIGKIATMLVGVAHLLPYAVRPQGIFNTRLLAMLFGLALAVWMVCRNARNSYGSTLINSPIVQT
jgi:hypothetical protein